MNNDEVAIECEFIALSDEFSRGQFGKINLLGLNLGEIVSVPQLPYQLISNIVIQGVMKGKSAPRNISVGIIYKDQKDFISFSNTVHYPPIISNNSKTSLSLVLPFKCHLKNLGKLELILLTNGARIKAKTFQMASGDGPCVSFPVSLASSSTIHGSNVFQLELILNGANNSLTLIDQYLKPPALMKLIKLVPNTAMIKVLTNPDFKNSYAQALEEISSLKHFLEVRVSKKFHDRFMIVNNSEHYHFGHSLKDLTKGRISRYSKLYMLDEINKLNDQFQTEWERSDKIIRE